MSCFYWFNPNKLPLALVVNKRGIEIDPNKIKVILDMPIPRTERKIKGFLGSL